jgi:sarcosine oxidase
MQHRLAKHYNTIVVGVGGAGSPTVYELARRGRRVLGLERFDIPHDMGSSHGHTRIIRLAYYEHPSYVMLLRRAYELWREIERHVGEHLLHITGSIDAGPADSWVFKGSLQSCREHGLPHEVLTGKELAARFPGYQLPHDTLALLQPEGGFLTPERCIVGYVNAAMALGAEVHGRECVLRWEPLRDGVRVTTDRDVYEADSLVITAGAWNSQLIPELRGLLTPERQVLAWLQPRRPELFAPERFPVFNLLVEEGRYYGFPVHGVPGFKFGRYHHLEEVVDPDDYEREPALRDEQILRPLAERYFPDGAGATMSLKSCMFTNTPDGHFIVDVHPRYPQVSFTSPCTGHGYKFASVIGEIMADLAERGETRHNIELFRLARFAGTVPRRQAHSPTQTVAPLQRRNGHHTHTTLNPYNGSLPLHEPDAIRPFW